MMRYKKITIHLLRLSALTILIHSGGGFSETQIFNGGTSQLNESSYTEGIEARNQAQVNNRPGQPLSLSSPGTGKAAVQVTGEGTSVMLEGTEEQKIKVETTEAGNSYGLWAKGESTLTAKHMAITFKGERDPAVYIEEAKKVDIGNSTITGTQNQFYGLWASGQDTEVTGNQLQINLNGDDSKAVTSYSAKITLKDSTISSHGNNSRGIVASEDTKVTGHHLNIKVGGQGARAINAAGSVDIQNSTLNINGENARGIIAFRTAKVTGHHLNIQVAGQDANAINANQNATIHLHDSNIQTLDKPSSILASDADATDTTVTITGGSLHAAGDLIVSKGGKTNLVFSKVDLSSPPGSGHAIHFTGTGGEVDLTLNQTALSGNIVAEGGNKAKVTLDSGSTWSFTNNATVTNLKNAGEIVFKSPHDTASFSTLTTDDYEGNSGKILFHARLEGDDSPANQLIINQSSKGTTRVTVRNVGGKGRHSTD